MGRREGFITRAEAVLPRRPSPNSQVPIIGCELRTFWPGNATRADVLDVLAKAYAQALIHVSVQPFRDDVEEFREQRRGTTPCPHCSCPQAGSHWPECPTITGATRG